MCMQALVKDFARRKILGVRKQQQTAPWGGGDVGDSHMKGAGMLIGNIELNP